MDDDFRCQLTNLTLVNFRNHIQRQFHFCAGINFLTGSNGAGKTNVLDAIYYLSMTRSSLLSADSQNIMHGADFFMVQGEYERKGQPENIYCGVKQGQRKIFRRNGKNYERMSEHVGLLPVVMVSPADGHLIVGGSEERRRLMSESVSQYDGYYMQAMIHYNHALEQRNALLKVFAANHRQFDTEMLDAWDAQLAMHGNQIFTYRTEYCRELIPVFQHYYGEISGRREQVSLTYRSQLQNHDFATLLRENEGKDRQLQYTSVGIHRDDLLLQMDGYPIRRTGSQGQQKTFLVALKLANYEFIRQKAGIMPVLLLDDIFDKFDAQRVSHIIKLVSGGNFGQIFITDTGREHIEAILQQTGGQYQLITINSQEN